MLNMEHVRPLASNGLQLAEVREYEEQNFNLNTKL